MESDFKILIVDDNPKNLQILAKLLKKVNYYIEFAINGKQALNWVNNTNFDLILLDVMMPEMDGFEVCTRIKQNPKFANIPIIFLTARNDTESIVKGFELGASDYVQKPFNPKELLMRVSNHLTLKKAKDDTMNYLNELQSKNKLITDSIFYAKRIQSALITPSEEIASVFPDHFILNMPKDVLSGDFYWLKEMDDKIYFAVADCTGHGVPGAMMSMLGISFLNDLVLKNCSEEPNIILDLLRNKIKKSLHQETSTNSIQDGLDIALCVFDTKTYQLKYSGAFNSLILFQDNKRMELKADRQPIGIYAKENKFTSQTIELKSGDSLYLFSDGYYDQIGGPNNKKLKCNQFLNLLFNVHKHNVSAQHNYLKDYFNEWKGNGEQIDDVLVMGVRL